MSDVPLAHNPVNGVTGGIWRRGEVVHKVLTRRRATVPHWAAREEPRHWNFWRREAEVHRSGLPERLGLRAPVMLGCRETPEGDLELRLEHVEGRHRESLTPADLASAARALGQAQGRADQPEEPWLRRGFLREYSGGRPTDFGLLEDDAAWAQPFVSAHFPPGLRSGLVRLHARREELLRLIEALPRTLCHLDVWPNNLVVRPGGEVVFLDWAFCGDGAVGEDVGNLVPDSVFDLHQPPAEIDELDARLSAGYLDGLGDAGWTGDPRVARLGICASAVKYDWLTVRTLEDAREAEQRHYGGETAVDPDARFAARAAGLGLCARWADEALALAAELGL